MGFIGAVIDAALILGAVLAGTMGIASIGMLWQNRGRTTQWVSGLPTRLIATVGRGPAFGIATAILLGGLVFYWYEVRPSQIRARCSKASVTQAQQTPVSYTHLRPTRPY